MNTTAIIMLIVTYTIISAFTGYFFYKVLVTKPHAEPDSFLFNDEEER